MGRQTGQVILTGVLDREVIAQYNLVAVATDENGAGLSSYVEVFVYVHEDINDVNGKLSLQVWSIIQMNL